MGEIIEEFQECVEDIIEELEEDEKFSVMTAESYDNKKCYLRKHLDELSRLHRFLADQHIHLIKEVSKNCPSLIKNLHQHPSDSASTSSTVKDDALKLKDVITEKSHLEVNEAEVVELQKQVIDLKLVISESDLKIKTMEEELEKSSKKLSIANTLIQNLKGERQENQMLQRILDTKQNQVVLAHEYLTSRAKDLREMDEQLQLLAVGQIERDDKIKKLETKNDRFKSDIARLAELLKSKEDIWNQDVANLKGQLKNQTKSTDDLKKQLNFSRSERNRINIKLKTLEEEKCSQKKLMKELETRLNGLRIEHERVVSSFEDAKKTQNELTLKMVNLEIEVETQKEVISVTTKEKIELETHLKALQVEYERVVSSFETGEKQKNELTLKVVDLEIEVESQKEVISVTTKEKIELETRLNALQVEHERVLSSFEDAEKIQSELTVKMVDLEIEVESQKEVISVTTKEKIEAIRQLSFSLEHYMSKYKQLRQLYAAKKRGCFDFLTGLNK